MISIGDASAGKRKTGDMGNAKNFPGTKSYNKHYGEKIAAGLFVIVAAIPLVNTVLDFFFDDSEKKKNERK